MIVDVANAAALSLSIGLLCVRRTGTAVQLCALQALVAAASLGETAVAIALLAFALNGIALPVAVARVDRTAMLMVRFNALVSWTATLVLLVATGITFARIGTGGSAAAGVSVTLLGLLLIVLRSHTLSVGMLSSQNGLVLVASAHPEISQAAALVVAVPLVPALVLTDSWLRR